MANSRSALLVALAFFWISCSNAEAQKADISSTGVQQQVLSLDVSNNGQHLAARVGQQIEISLGTVGPTQYGAPEISSPAIRLESVAQKVPQNPGGPWFVYIFEATSEGEAQVKVPIVNCCIGDPSLAKELDFSVTIRVGRTDGGASTPYASRMLDQANTAPWKDAWTNLEGNFLRQTFTPSLPRLTAVEVELVVGNPGPPSAEATMFLGSAEGKVLAVVSKTVPVDDCGHVLFVFPNGGLRVLPGEVYSIQLSGGSVFGWKYVEGGYANGAAWFNGKPLLHDVRSTFLFRTFGAS
jgi:hypothetical protein